MKKMTIALCVAALLAAGTFVLAQSQSPAKPPPDPRIDKLIEQNEKILKNQEEILKQLDLLQTQLTQVRRRGS